MELKHLRLVLSSPGDVAAEREAMVNVIDELNRSIAQERRLHLDLIRWETDAAPGVHPDGPQGVIDAALDIQNAEIVIGIFWKRFGTPTKTAASGTDQELRAALKNFDAAGKPRVMIYFKEAERPLRTAEDYEQFSRVQRFREEFSPQGLYWTFQDTPEFEGLVRRHLTDHLLDHFPAGSTEFTGRPNHQELRRRYCQNLRQKFSTIQLFGEKGRDDDGPDRMADITQGFVPLHLQDWRDAEIEAPNPPLDIDALFFNDTPPRHFLLRGLPGSGKTTLLRYLAHRYASLGVAGEKNYVQIYLRCKTLDLSDATLEKLIQNQINQNCDGREMFNALCNLENSLEDHGVLLFDGVDEIEHAETAKNFAAALKKLVQEHPRCKIIVASRPIGLSRADFPQFRALDVLKLAEAMIDDYLRKWFAGEQTKIAALQAVLKDKPRIRALAENPFLLIDGLAQSLPLLPESERQSLVQETLEILLIKCEERDCEVIFHAQELLEKIGLQPLQPDGLIYALFDLEHAAERQQKFLNDPANHFEWIAVEGGEFWMGDDEHYDDEKPAHRVRVDGFRMAKHPVTNRLLADFKFATHYDEDENLPATGNPWYEAYYFARWIDGRLPTEAEWEYAARGGKPRCNNIQAAGQRTPYYFGDAEEELPNHAWFGEIGRSLAHAVDEINPRTGKENLNPLGLANMLGNVWAWCQDWYGKYPTPENEDDLVENPRGPMNGQYKVLRGGGFTSSADGLRGSGRNGDLDDRYLSLGFRVCVGGES